MNELSEDRLIEVCRYGPPKVAQRVANLSLEAMIHLSIYEFTTPEKEDKLGIMVSSSSICFHEHRHRFHSFGRNGIMVYCCYTVVTWQSIISFRMKVFI